MTGIPKPLPASTEDTKEFWDACKRHELVMQRCTQCGSYGYPPRPGCWNCGSLSKEWVNVSGEGVVHTYTIVWRPAHPAFQDKAPYNVVVVELPGAGNIRMVSNLIDCNNDDILSYLHASS